MPPTIITVTATRTPNTDDVAAALDRLGAWTTMPDSTDATDDQLVRYRETLADDDVQRITVTDREHTGTIILTHPGIIAGAIRNVDNDITDVIVPSLDVIPTPVDSPPMKPIQVITEQIGARLIVTDPGTVMLPGPGAGTVHADHITTGPDDEQDDQDDEDDERYVPTRVGEHPAPAAGKEHTGRPPVGYDLRFGALHPSDDYADVREALLAHDAGRISRPEAAERAGTSRSTIKRIINDPARRKRYALD